MSHLNEDHENELNCHYLVRVPLTTVTLVSSVLFVHLTVHGKTLPLQATAGRNRHFRWENFVLLSVHSAPSLEWENSQYSDFAFHRFHIDEVNFCFYVLAVSLYFFFCLPLNLNSWRRLFLQLVTLTMTVPHDLMNRFISVNEDSYNYSLWLWPWLRRPHENSSHRIY